VNLGDIADVLADRAAHAGLAIDEQLASRLIVYFQVLNHWNRKINLTSLSNQDEAVDRLLLEPVAAAEDLPHGVDLIDLGSGGGSPAVPLALATAVTRLVMVESRERKAAFLREVVRELGLTASVEARRFEELPQIAGYESAFGLLSVRAVRLDAGLFSIVARLLRPGGTAALFRALEAEDPPRHLPATLHWAGSRQLIPASHSALTRLVCST
jgi:16S rRNA (guanine527-N7)-methyltransferase